jgi:GxxExxY protein
MITENQVAQTILDVAFEVHRRWGPGLLESAYHALLLHGLRKRDLAVQTQVPVTLRWDDVLIDVGFRADLIVGDLVIVELKSVEKLADVHRKQLLTYLKVAGKQLGLLINFGEALLKDGICRIANNMPQ